ncbi:hypothetical protein OUZ56_011265 [Daphnia magna]|uniref:Uncharacterized protein n=1 Tax=Daphnia magna TaxID=35525 RepID=A0ABQ9YZS4_9CRUS|nr:hypothetical protein OUZ56_011265 [Daphnia magna]
MSISQCDSQPISQEDMYDPETDLRNNLLKYAVEAITMPINDPVLLELAQKLRAHILNSSPANHYYSVRPLMRPSGYTTAAPSGQIAAMEHQEHINKLEKMQMAAELWMKEAVIVAQTFDMLQLREEFMMQVKKAKENEDKFKNMLDGLSPKERLVVKTIIDKVNCCHGKGMRYDAEWLMECLLMRMKSPKAYKHLR